MSALTKIRYYLWASYHRKKLDQLQTKHKDIYKGTVLDIGGRDRGSFAKPKDSVKRWIFADIEANHNPDLVIDVTDMRSQIKDHSIDVVNAIELFEHVNQTKKGLKECHRILKDNGAFVIAAPFLYPVHADPFDYQRWTQDKWEDELKAVGFEIQSVEVIGYFFTIYADMIKTSFKLIPHWLRYLRYLLHPLFDVVYWLDRFCPKSPVLNKYHGGYFIIAKKRR